MYKRVLLFAAVSLTALIATRPAHAQWPGELAGVVVDAASGAAVDGATVLVAGRVVTTDASGRFTVPRLPAGTHRLQIVRIGYREATLDVEIRNAETAHVRALVLPVPIDLAPLVVAARQRGDATPFRIDRDAIAASAARNAADLVASLPGVVVRRDGPGDATTLSLRGSHAGAVLVLVDGVPLNDPATGRADLSRIPAHRIESVAVVPGAVSARYGPGAEAGAVLIDTRPVPRSLALRLEVGSFGEAGAGAERLWGGPSQNAGLSVAYRRLRGDFVFDVPPSAGGGSGRRVNADITEADARLSGRMPAAAGELDGAVFIETLERGVPGRSFAPTPHARQGIQRVAASARWRLMDSARSTSLAWNASGERFHYRDPQPPFGAPVDVRTDVRSTSLRLERQVERDGLLRRAAYGGDTRVLQILSPALVEVPIQWHGGAYGGAVLGPRRYPNAGIEVGVRGDALTGRSARASHAAMVFWERSGLRVHAAHRSAFTPPTPADQFFRAGVGIAPNPRLLPERLPSELELGGRADGQFGPARLGVGTAAYRSDIRDMIVWTPDHRFVWSPRNVDVKRRGLDVWADAHAGSLSLRASYSLTDVVYDDPAGPDTLPLPYRPRHTGSIRAEWRRTEWRAEISGRYTGLRYPAPARLNALPAFWTWEAGASREIAVNGWHAFVALRVEHLFNERDSLIFGYPGPGRIARVSMTLRPDRRPHP